MDGELAFVLVITGFHVLGLGVLAGMLYMAFRSDEIPPRRFDDGEGGGGADPAPDRSSGGSGPDGLPLPDASPARVRLREPRRLRDALPSPARRPAHPARPEPGRQPERA